MKGKVRDLMVRLGFSDGDGYNKGKYERGGFHDNSFPLTPSKKERE
ncbi:hypothetical protein NXV33_04600 [Bacteroides thetaiotaomicron]|nr:hypothetical protein [Bacteroides faecis]MCS2764733.1 hypothetical protein [Bacteroides thetaiotaomicron]UVQ24808.1 hypothetical protein NXX60_07535 [Bacteroides thetaiotaomicron]UVS32405.1 hypothetical protein NXX87_16240 [Bacteroides faecis]